ncbi:PTS sugar transporter subunit IIB [Desnuesiella massiliensis]|uniref:PTS sugar transporter subunit IIB n=1 Tax=Desnuesiella massiliensis TaxID=1650662 RepID=UPI0006E1FE85|nr:PTS sugar transporter subunit IIB [Desnuesiella massiliensis]
MKIALCRVDERLIHGQVMTSWIGNTGAQRIVIIDDDLYNDDFMKQVLILAAPPNIKIQVLNVNKFIELIGKNENDKKTIILFKHPKYVLEILKKGLELNEIIIGNMGPNSEREKVTKNVYISSKERDLLRDIEQLKCMVFLQMLPSDEKVLFNI